MACYFFGYSSLHFSPVLFFFFFFNDFKHSSGNSKEQNGNAAWTLSTQVVLDFDTCGWMERVTRAFVLVCSRLTKPLSFADCVGDELPWGWEAGFDPQIGVYYIDHINSEFFLFSTNKHVRQVIPPNLESYRRANTLQNEFLYFKPSL